MSGTGNYKSRDRKRDSWEFNERPLDCQPDLLATAPSRHKTDFYSSHNRPVATELNKALFNSVATVLLGKTQSQA